MPEADPTPNGPASRRAGGGPESRAGEVAPAPERPGTRSAEAPRRRLQQRLRELKDRSQRQYAASPAGNLFQRLAALDVINRAMLFAAVMLLCLFPFLIVVDALAGRSNVAGISRHLGLNHQAAADVAALFASTTATSAAVNGAGYVFFVLGGIAAASAIQDLYERAFQLEGRGMKDILRRLIWLAIAVTGSAFAGWAGPFVDSTGGPVLLGFVGWIMLALFWWFTSWFLLAGRLGWRALVPTAVATSLLWIGMILVFRFTFSGMVISNHNEYGPIGVVLSLMTWLIAIGVVIVLGAVVGLVWRVRGLRFSAAIRRLTSGRQRRPG